MGLSSPQTRPPADCPVDSIRRRDRTTRWNHQTVHEGALNSIGAQSLVRANPRRICLILYSPPTNSGNIEWGGQNMQVPSNTTAVAAVDGGDMEPGTGWEIDDTTDAIFVMSAPGTGDQIVKWVEYSDVPRQPL
jgi:hypothetical protein